ncbi:MAG: hypothetical protein AABO41_00835 [Acidobacteriota bacterium]
MTSEKEKLIEVIVKLIRETQEGKIRWDIKEPPASLKLDVDAAVDLAYETEYKGKRLRLYKENYVVERGLIQRDPILDNLLGTKYPHWAANIMLEITDEKGKTLWTFPDVNGLDDLLDSVEYQAAGVSDFLDEIVSDKVS